MQDRLLSAIETIYDCVDDGFDHKRALAAFGEVTGDPGLFLGEVGLFQRGISTAAIHNMPEEAVTAAIRGNFDAKSHSLFANFARIPEGVPVLRRSFVSDEENLESRYHRETSAPWGFHSEGVTILHKGLFGGFVCSFVKHPGQEEVGHEALSTMTVLNRHLWRAMNLQRRIDKLEENLILSNGVLDLINFGLVLYRGREMPDFVNQSAERMFNGGDGITLGSKGLIIADRTARDQFEALLSPIHRGDVPLAAQSGGIVLVPRDSRKKPYSLMVVPMPGRAQADMAGVSAAVFLFDPSAKKTTAVSLFASSYGLTRSEAVLAFELAEGTSVGKFAEKRGLSRNTVKWHLRSIFAKTETSRQPELVSLLLRSVAGINLKD